MRKNIRTIVHTLPAMLLFTACQPSDEQQVSERAEEFACAYFNMDFDTAAEYCAPEAIKWIAFRASNITGQDIGMHNDLHCNAQVSVMKIQFRNDSSAEACCLVENAIAADLLEEKQGQVNRPMKWWIPLVKRDKAWYVKMEAPLQNAE